MAFFKRVAQEKTAISSITPGIAVFLYLSVLLNADSVAMDISKYIMWIWPHTDSICNAPANRITRLAFSTEINFQKRESVI